MLYFHGFIFNRAAIENGGASMCSGSPDLNQSFLNSV